MKIFNLFLVGFIFITINTSAFAGDIKEEYITDERNLFCEQVSQTAGYIMFLHQANYSKEDILKKIEFNDEYLELTQDIIRDASYWRIEDTIKGKIEVIKDYTYQIDEACLKQ